MRYLKIDGRKDIMLKMATSSTALRIGWSRWPGHVEVPLQLLDGPAPATNMLPG